MQSVTKSAARIFFVVVLFVFVGCASVYFVMLLFMLLKPC